MGFPWRLQGSLGTALQWPPSATNHMFLKPPDRDTKPRSNRSLKGALTGKAAAKPPVFKQAGEAAEAAPPKEVAPFALWAKAQDQNVGIFQQQVLEYLANGPPYLGDSIFEAKDALKELGSRFYINPEKPKDCTDRSVRRGWWSAPDEVVLGKLLRLSVPYNGRRQWTCLHLVETQVDMVLDWLDKYEAQRAAPPNTAPQDAPPVAHFVKRRRRAPSPVPEWIARAADGKHMRPWLPDPTCPDCRVQVTDQFLECGCCFQGVTWQRCAVCTAKYRTDGKHRCQCGAR